MNKRIAIIGKNSAEYINLVLDIWNQNDVVVLIDWRMPPAAINNIIEENNIEKCYIDNTVSKSFNHGFEQHIFIIYHANVTFAQKLSNEVTNKFVPRYDNNDALILFSSGTTGNAKGIVLSHNAINTNADLIINQMKVTSNDCIYLAKTLSHSSTFVGELLVALKTKCNLIVSPTIVSPNSVFKNIQKFNVTILCTNPTLLSLYTTSLNKKHYELCSLRSIYVSGEYIATIKLIEARNTFYPIPIYNMYGLTECGPRVCMQSKNHCTYNSVGKALPNIRIKILNKNSCSAKTGEIGTIYIKTPCLFSRYISGEKAIPNDQHGWFNSGDLGYFDANNELFVVGRIDDLIIIDAHKIYPSQIEETISAYYGIHECSVVSVIHKNRHILCCIYVSDIEYKNIRKTLAKFLLPYEIPQVYLRIDALPKTSNGKVSRSDVVTIIKDYLSTML